MQKYQKRVIKELEKLERKACKLQDFINSDEYPFYMDSENDQLMTSQLHSMWVYASILKRRIEKFDKAIASDPEIGTTDEDDLFKNIGVVEIEDGDVKTALDEVFNIVKNQIKEDNARNS